MPEQPRYTDDLVTLHAGNCLDVLRALPDASVDAVVTDPPYGLADHKPAALVDALTAWANGDRERVPDGRGFMGREWDRFVPPPAVWDECLRVLKPGGHLVAFAGSRTYDLMGLSIRMAGFEVRDGLAWLYGSGFPKSLDVGKAIDATLVHGKSNSAGIRAANASRPGEGRIAPQITNNGHMGEKVPGSVTRDEPATAEAARWEGWGTALKPGHEPIVLARKPLGGTVAATVLAHGTGALNIDATRVGTDGGGTLCSNRDERGRCRGHRNAGRSTSGETFHGPDTSGGRWPANVLLGHDPACAEQCDPGCPVAELDAQSGNRPGMKRGTLRRGATTGRSIGGTSAYGSADPQNAVAGYDDEGGASRFFPAFRYQAKAPTRERPKVDGVAHPTCKPLTLMQWLVRLVTPPGGTILEPFAGSGTTVEAAMLEGFRVIAVEQEPTYLPLIEQRVTRARTVLAERVAADAARAAVQPDSLFDLPA